MTISHRVLGVNGIFTQGQGSTDLMLGQLTPLAYESVDVAIPVRDVYACRFDDVNAADAWRVLCKHKPGDVVVAHSRGALVVHYAMQTGLTNFSHVFLFAPAMESDVVWPAGAEHIHVIHNPDDPALKAGTLLLNHPFGDLGLTGYDGPPDPRITNFEWRYPGHSCYFLPVEIIRWARYIQGAFTASAAATAGTSVPRPPSADL